MSAFFGLVTFHRTCSSLLQSTRDALVPNTCIPVKSELSTGCLRVLNYELSTGRSRVLNLDILYRISEIAEILGTMGQREVAGLELCRVVAIIKYQNAEKPVSGWSIIYVVADPLVRLFIPQYEKVSWCIQIVQMSFPFELLRRSPIFHSVHTRNLLKLEMEPASALPMDTIIQEVGKKYPDYTLLDAPLIPDELQEDFVFGQWRCGITKRCVRYPVLVCVRGLYQLCERVELARWKYLLGNDVCSDFCNEAIGRYVCREIIPGLNCKPSDVVVLDRLHQITFKEIENRLTAICRRIIELQPREPEVSPPVNGVLHKVSNDLYEYVSGYLCNSLKAMQEQFLKNQECCDHLAIIAFKDTTASRLKRVIAFGGFTFGTILHLSTERVMTTFMDCMLFYRAFFPYSLSYDWNLRLRAYPLSGGNSIYHQVQGIFGNSIYKIKKGRKYVKYN